MLTTNKDGRIKKIKIIQTIVKNDLRQIFRDKMLLFVLVYPIFFLLLGRWLIEGVLRKNVLYANYEIFFVGITYALMPMMFAFVLGFICLEEKDDHLYDVIRTRPFSPSAFLALRIILIMGMAFIFNLFIPWCYDITYFSSEENVLLAFISASGSIILGLIIAAYAQNKVEGMAWFKIVGMITMLPLASSLVFSDWQYAFGVIYTYWPIKIVIASATGIPPSLIWLWIGAILIHSIYFLFALKLFQRRVFN